MDRNKLTARLREPASAAIAGIVFALILGSVIYLLHHAVPVSLGEAGEWVDDPGRRGQVNAALNLIPFAGIAFLWFIGVIRAQVGSAEDRFVETVFMGSGVLLVAMLFGAAASLKAILVLDGVSFPLPNEMRAYGWALAASLLGQFGTRMAAVFIASVATVGSRTHALPRWLAVIGYLVALILLLTPPVTNLAQFLFPAWVLILSIYLLTGRHAKRAEAHARTRTN